MAKDNPTKELIIPPEGIVLEPGHLYLGATVEHTETYNLVPFIEGRSSVARLGLSIHLTAGFGESNFQGTWTLEMTVVYPLRVYAGVELCQIGYSPLVGESTDYKGKYQGQTGPKASQLWKEFQEPSN
jgi:dCTP deaminase